MHTLTVNCGRWSGPVTGDLLVDRQAFTPFLGIFLQEPDGIFAGIILIDGTLQESQDKEGHVIQPDLAGTKRR